MGTFSHGTNRCKAFTGDDYAALCQLLGDVPEVIVTPNTLTETSNLAAQVASPWRERVMEVLRKLILQSPEQVVSSKVAAARPEFVRLGLTDAALLSVAADDVMLLTTDLQLFLAAKSARRPAINFNHYREGWL